MIRRMEEVNSEVHRGVTLADSTGGILERIVARVGELKQMINMVANSASEQSQATNEISDQAVKVNNSVKETGKAVSQSTASTKEIATISEKLE